MVPALLTLAACNREEPRKTAAPEPAKSQIPLEVLASNCSIDQFKVNGLRTNSSLGQIFFAHPKSACSWTPPANAKYLFFGYGIDDGALSAKPKTGGVAFRISERTPAGENKALWSRSLDPVSAPADRGLQSGVFTLALSGGSQLVFETEPLAGAQNNWAYWTKLSAAPDFDPQRVLSENKLMDQFNVSGPKTVPPLGQILFAHPHSVFALPLPAPVRSVQFSYGILDGALKADPPTQGVEFRIILEPSKGPQRTLWTHSLKPVTVEADRGPHSETVTVSGGTGDRLLFETLPVKGTPNNWGYWTGLTIQTGSAN